MPENEFGHGHGFIVYVRNEANDGTGHVYGIFSRLSSAQKKANAINWRLLATHEVAMAYVLPLRSATERTEKIAVRATREAPAA